MVMGFTIGVGSWTGDGVGDTVVWMTGNRTQGNVAGVVDGTGDIAIGVTTGDTVGIGVSVVSGVDVGAGEGVIVWA